MREILCQILSLYVLAIFLRIVLSWFPNQRSGVMARVNGILFRVTEPIMAPPRRFLPPMGAFDLSPIVVILFLQIVVGRIILRC